MLVVPVHGRLEVTNMQLIDFLEITLIFVQFHQFLWLLSNLTLISV